MADDSDGVFEIFRRSGFPEELEPERRIAD